MCGLAGFCLKPGQHNDLDTNAVARELLLGVEERGRDATGAAWFGRNGGLTLQKAPVEATRFTHKLTMGNRTGVAILHTRLSTTGSPKQNENNHPIVSPGIRRGTRVIGTHNGWVNNVGTLIDAFQLPRAAAVDSEVIFSLIAKYGEDFDLIGRELYGHYACAWVHEDRPNTLYLMRGKSSPLVLLQSRYGVFYASTIRALQTIEPLVGKPDIGYLTVEEGRAVTVVDGEITDTKRFEFQEDTYDTYTYGRYSDGWKYTPNGRWERTGVGLLDDNLDDTGWPNNSFHSNRWNDDFGNTRTYPPITTRPETLLGTKYYINETKNRVSLLGKTAEAAAKWLELTTKDETTPSQFGYYLYTSALCIEFIPYEHNRSSNGVDETCLEDLLYLSATNDHGEMPTEVKAVLDDLMERCWDDEMLNNWANRVTEFDEHEGVLPTGEQYKEFAGEVMLYNPDTKEWEGTGLSYREYMTENDARFEQANAVDDAEVEQAVERTTEALEADKFQGILDPGSFILAKELSNS